MTLRTRALVLGLAAAPMVASPELHAQEAPRFTAVVRQTNGDVALKFAVTTGRYCRLETADQLSSWQPLATLRSSGTNLFTDGGSQL